MIRIKLIAIYLLVSLSSIAQTISGKVVDKNGTAIQNALISHSNDLSIWTKSDENGNFELRAKTGDILKIAALHFETESTFKVTSTNGQNFEMSQDKLLNSDVYHISFDHLRPGDYYTKEELKDDFPVPSGAGFYELNNETTNRALIDTNESVDPNGKSLRVRFPKGQLKTANSGVDTRIPLAKTYKDNDFDGEELYLSYWIKFSDNFEFDKCGGKLPSLGGSDLGVRNNEWKGRIMWRNGGAIQFYMELPHSEDKFESDDERFWGEKEFDGGDICTNRFTPYLGAPGWHNIELHYKMDDGTPTGLFEGWVDGDKGHKIINSEVFGFYRKTGEGLETLTTNAILLSAFLGGSSPDYEPSEDVFAWFDEFRVSKTRINEYKTYSNPVLSISDSKSSDLIKPNPSNNGIFELETPQQWTIWNVTGQKIKEGNTAIVNLSDENKGIYIIRTENTSSKIEIN